MFFIHLLAFLFGLHFMSIRHEVRLHLKNKNKQVYFVFSSVCTNFAKGCVSANYGKKHANII